MKYFLLSMILFSSAKGFSGDKKLNLQPVLKPGEQSVVEPIKSSDAENQAVCRVGERSYPLSKMSAKSCVSRGGSIEMLSKLKSPDESSVQSQMQRDEMKRTMKERNFDPLEHGVKSSP